MPVRRTSCLILVALACGVPPGAAHASAPAPSSLDTSFAGSGIRQISEGGIKEVHDFLDYGGRYVVVGETGGEQNLVIAAVDADTGAVDDSFGGGDGYTVVDLIGGTTDQIETLAIAEQVVGEVSRLVVTGTTRPAGGGTQSSFVIRFDSSGLQDFTFNGRTHSGANIDYIAEDVVIRPGGEIVLIGQRREGAAYFAHIDLVSADGASADSISHTLEANAEEGLRAGVLDGDGKLVAVGQVQNFNTATKKQLVTRWDLSAKAPDATFDSDGWATIDYAGNDDDAHAVAMDPRTDPERIVVGGWHKDTNVHYQTVSRLNGDGTLNIGFDEDGMKSFLGGSYARVESLDVDHSSGYITGGGRTQIGSQRYVSVFRLQPTGEFDTTFDPSGDHDKGDVGGNTDEDKASVLMTDPNNFLAEGTAMALDGEGRIVVSGFLGLNYGSGDKGVLMRFLGATAPVPVSVAINDVTVQEGGLLTFEIIKTGGGPATVRYSTTEGGTASTADFTPIQDASVVYTADETYYLTGIATTEDTADEPDETVQVKLTTSDPNVTFTDDTGVGTITDDDEPKVDPTPTPTPEPTASPAATASPSPTATATPAPTVGPGDPDVTAPKADVGSSSNGSTIGCAASCKINGPAYSEGVTGTATVSEGSGTLVAAAAAKKPKLKFKPVKFSVAPGVRAAITLKLNAKNRKILKKRRKVKLTVTFTARDSAGNVTRTPIKVTLKPKK